MAVLGSRAYTKVKVSVANGKQVQSTLDSNRTAQQHKEGKIVVLVTNLTILDPPVLRTAN